MLTTPSDSQEDSSSLNALLAKYDRALDLYDDLAKDISQMKKATQLVRQKTMKLLETKIRRKRALSIQGEALDVLLAAGVKAQQRRKAAGTRKSRRLSAASSTHLKSPAKRRGSILLEMPVPADNLKVHFDLPVIPARPISARSVPARRSAKKAA